MEKKASEGRIRLAASESNLRRIKMAFESDPDKQEEEEDAFFEAVEETLLDVTAKQAKTAGEDWFLPGQVLREFYPEMEGEMLRYPAQNNSGMPEGMGSANPAPPVGSAFVSDAPASGAMNPKPSVLQESVPLRRELQLRGPGYMNDFYRSVVTIDPSNLQMAASKSAAADEASFNAKEEMTNILQGVCGEIVATLVAAYKVSMKPLASGVPGEGHVCLVNSSPSMGTSTPSVSTQWDVFLADRIRTMCTKLNDGDLQDIINDAWAQGAVWCKGDKGGFTYEVLVRAESFDDQTLELRYKYLVNVK
jgi:hypothetical protein